MTIQIQSRGGRQSLCDGGDDVVVVVVWNFKLNYQGNLILNMNMTLSCDAAMILLISDLNLRNCSHFYNQSK